MNRSGWLVLVSAAMALAIPSSAKAAESYDNCSGFIDSVPATITTQGVWCLRADLSTAISSGNAITVATNNVTIDCNNFKLGGLAAGAATQTSGVYAASRLNILVTNCSIRGFRNGLWFQAGAGHVVQDSRFDGNTWIGIRMNATNSVVRRNLVVDTGGSTNSTDAYGMVFGGEGDGTEISDNIVVGVAPAISSQNAYGIWLGSVSQGNVRNNRVRGLLAAQGSSIAIFGNASHGVIMDGNVLHGPPAGASVGISCVTNTGTAVRNTLRRFSEGIVNCAGFDNFVNNN